MVNHKLGYLSILLIIVCSLFGGTQAYAQNNLPFRVYMAFEDGPTDAYTPQILDILQEYNAKATFFINGYQIAGHEDILQRIILEGHAIANHLWEEPGHYAGSPDEQILESYWRTENALREALGDTLPIYETQQKLFRHPGGSVHALPEIEGVDVITYNPSVDSDDCGWFLDSSGNYDAGVLANLLGDPVSTGGNRWNVFEYGDGVVISFHDINRVTGRVLPLFLEELQRANASFHALPRPGDLANTLPILLGTPPVQGSGVNGFTMEVELKDYAFVRTLPQAGSELLVVSLAPETRLIATGRNAEWYRVNIDGQEGWIWRNNVYPRGPVPYLPHVNS